MYTSLLQDEIRLVVRQGIGSEPGEENATNRCCSSMGIMMISCRRGWFIRYAAKPQPKELFIGKGSAHAKTYEDHKVEYISHM